ncbi:MAG TPA: terminase family protein, partial [Candidatus Limnocylindrales bacterium]
MAWHDGLSPDEVRLLLAMGGLLSLGLQGRVAAWLQSARPEQLPPEGVWRVWLILSGRGWGKTRTGAETVISWIAEGTVTHVAIVGQTREDVRNVMVAALLKSAGTDAVFSESHLELTFPSGAVIRGFSAEDPDSLRGHQFDAAWCDELGAWRRPEAFDQLQMCVRVGEGRIIVTTTPRPIPVIRALLADPTTVVTRGRTLDNVANLSQGAVNYLFGRY